MAEDTTGSKAPLKILSVDIGGSHVKATLLDTAGQSLKDYEKVDTPVPATPEKIMAAILQLAKKLPGYDRVSAGFPGYIKTVLYSLPPTLALNTGKEQILVNCWLLRWENLPGW